MIKRSFLGIVLTLSIMGNVFAVQKSVAVFPAENVFTEEQNHLYIGLVESAFADKGWTVYRHYRMNEISKESVSLVQGLSDQRKKMRFAAIAGADYYLTVEVRKEKDKYEITARLGDVFDTDDYVIDEVFTYDIWTEEGLTAAFEALPERLTARLEGKSVPNYTEKKDFRSDYFVKQQQEKEREEAEKERLAEEQAKLAEQQALEEQKQELIKAKKRSYRNADGASGCINLLIPGLAQITRGELIGYVHLLAAAGFGVGIYYTYDEFTKAFELYEQAETAYEAVQRYEEADRWALYNTLAYSGYFLTGIVSYFDHSGKMSVSLSPDLDGDGWTVSFSKRF